MPDKDIELCRVCHNPIEEMDLQEDVLVAFMRHYRSPEPGLCSECWGRIQPVQPLSLEEMLAEEHWKEAMRRPWDDEETTP